MAKLGKLSSCLSTFDIEREGETERERGSICSFGLFRGFLKVNKTLQDVGGEEREREKEKNDMQTKAPIQKQQS